MKRSASLAAVLTALVAAGTAACSSGAATSSAGPTSTPAAATVPVAKASTRTVTVTVTSSPVAPEPTSPSTTTKTSTPAPTASAVSFKPFVGEWDGHTRFVAVSASGRMEEHVGDGCCDPVIDLVLQLSDPHRAGGGWAATSRVISAKVHAGWKGTGLPAPKPGDRGTVTVGADHILVESISGNGFCDPEKTAPGTCGA
jgi:hypothetical protein